MVAELEVAELEIPGTKVRLATNATTCHNHYCPRSKSRASPWPRVRRESAYPYDLPDKEGGAAELELLRGGTNLGRLLPPHIARASVLDRRCHRPQEVCPRRRTATIPLRGT